VIEIHLQTLLGGALVLIAVTSATFYALGRAHGSEEPLP
jgi:hypothetical protein